MYEISHVILIFFREEYGEDTTAFLFVSDDMEWAKNDEALKAEKNIFFEGQSTHLRRIYDVP